MLQIVIPARYQSLRLPGKPLIKINGKPMLYYVYSSAIEAFKSWDQTIQMLPPMVSTDSELIKNYCKETDIPCVMSGPSKTGTDRVYKTVKDKDIDFIVNLQGDEPTLSSNFIKQFCIETINTANDKKIMNGYCDLSEYRALDKNNVKAIVSYSGSICFLTRLPQPSFLKGSNMGYHKQIGLYGFTKNALNNFCSLPPSNLEEISNIELMRWLDNGNKISGVYSSEVSYSVDVIEDVLIAERIIDLRNF